MRGQGQAEDVSRSTICTEPALATVSVDGSYGISKLNAGAELGEEEGEGWGRSKVGEGATELPPSASSLHIMEGELLRWRRADGRPWPIGGHLTGKTTEEKGGEKRLHLKGSEGPQALYEG